MRNHACDIASATSEPAQIVLNFGATRSSGGSGTDLAVQLIQRIALQPLTVKNLHEMLQKLIAEAEANSRGVR